MRVRKAVFPAAGLGTRFLPATKAQPKEMLPLVDKPMIQYVVEEAVASGLDRDHHRHRARQARHRGPLRRGVRAGVLPPGAGQAGGAGRRSRPSPSWPRSPTSARRSRSASATPSSARARWSATSPSPCSSATTSSSPRHPCMRQLLDVYERYGGPVLAVERVPARADHPLRRDPPRSPSSGNVYEVHDLVEKPAAREAPSDLAIIGRYVLTPDLFPILAETPPDHRGEIQLTDALRTLRRTRRCTPWSSRASATTPATSSASSRPPWSSPWPVPTSPTPSAPT